MTEQARLRRRISAVQFAAWELHLYLDSHPHCAQAADKLALLPHFHGMGVPQLVHTDVGRYHVGNEPRPVLPGAGSFRTGADDLPEAAVLREAETPGAECAAERCADVELFREQHTAGVRRPP